MRGLQNWLRRGGWAPDILSPRRLGNDWNRTVITAACGFMTELASQVLEDPDGIPRSVPFSVSCCECDASSPGSFDDALAEGWTEIAFFPQSVAENFIGLCPEHSAQES